MKKFLILSSQRSGSTYLQQLLNSHPEIIVGGEIFNNNPRHLIEKEHITEELVNLKDTDPEEFLNHFFLSKAKSSTKLIGFRLFYEHGWSQRESVWNIFKNIPDLSLIHLQRKNYLKQFLSLKLAEKTSHWVRKKTEQPIEYEPILIDYRECIRYFRRQKRKAQRAVDFFENNEILDIFYENLAIDQNSETNKLLKFLESRPVTLKCDLGKQNTQSLSETISNYYQLKNRFKDTAWEDYFED